MVKPHLYKFVKGEGWYCLDGRWLGWGYNPAEAYKHWRERHRVYSCIHMRETPLQRRRQRAENIAMRQALGGSP